MAWLWAQFCVSKTVSVKKFLIGGTPVRKSTVNHPFIVENSYNWGGMIEFYKSKDSKKWTDAGLNVPHYPALSSIWSDMIGKAVRGELSAEETMKELAEKQDEILSMIKLKRYSPRLNAKRNPKYWLEKDGAPKKERGEQKAETISYDKLIKSWEE
jgi:glycerol transport system substrate-binding protein